MGTRPHLAFSVGKLPQLCEAPAAAHWNAVKLVPRYVKGPRDLKVCFTGSGQLDVWEYSDSDWDGDTRDCKSTGGYLYMMASGAISWCSCK